MTLQGRLHVTRKENKSTLSAIINVENIKTVVDTVTTHWAKRLARGKDLLIWQDILTSLVDHVFEGWVALGLSKRERECLLCAAFGMSAQETGLLLHIGTSTVNTHRENVIHKLRCNNIVQAVFTSVCMTQPMVRESGGECV